MFSRFVSDKRRSAALAWGTGLAALVFLGGAVGTHGCCPYATMGWLVAAAGLGGAALVLRGRAFEWTRSIAASSGDMAQEGGVVRVGDDAAVTPALRPVVFRSIAEVPAEDWERVMPADAPYVQRDYLAVGEGDERRYALIYRDERPVAAACFEVVDVDPAGLGGDVARWAWPLRATLRLVGGGRSPAVRVLVCGSALHTETCGFATTSELRGAEAGDALAELIARLGRDERAAVTVLKDLSLDGAAEERLRARGYHAVPGAQPTMTVRLEPAWTSFEDYLAAMSAKYRKRARVARTAGEALERRALCARDVRERRAELEALLEPVVARADFKLAEVSVDDVAALGEALGDDFEVWGYELSGRLVGFSAAMVHDGRFEALWVGLDYDVSRDLGLYQNMLYDFVARGIERGCRTVHLGRTAMEIKSTVGAEPETLAVFVRHRSRIANAALGFALRSAEPEAWTQRRPFRS